MKKYILLLLILMTSLIYSCSFQDDDVPEPKGTDKVNYTPIDPTLSYTLVGKYNINSLNINKTNQLYTSYLDGIVNIRLHENGNLNYNYALKYQGYNNDNDTYISNTKYIENIEYEILDNKSIKLKTPININGEKYSYNITSLQKYDNSPEDNMTEANIIKSYTLCDPKVEGDCSSVDGALKYIGYYRVEKVTCNNKEYTGGTDLVGEMVAVPSLARLSNSIVDLPLDFKMQIKNDTLKNCFLRQEEQNENNLYIEHNQYEIRVEGDLDLPSIFTQVGLLGITDDNADEVVRTTEIDYKPKHENYTDKTFGDNNNTVTMRLKLIKQGIANAPSLRYLDNQPYF